MSRNPSLLIPADYSPVPSEATDVDVSAVAALDPSALDAVAVLVHADGDLPGDLGTDLDRAALTAAGFDGSIGSSLVVARVGAPVLVLVGAGPAGALDAAARARCRGRRRPCHVAHRGPARHPGSADRRGRGGRGPGGHRGCPAGALPVHRAPHDASREAADPAGAGPRRRRRRPGCRGGVDRHRHQPRRSHRPRPGQRPARAPHGIRHGRRRRRAGRASTASRSRRSTRRSSSSSAAAASSG